MPNGFVHLELSTDNVGEAKSFYKKVFDWKIIDNKEMQYSMIEMGKGKTGGGMTGKMMPNQPTAWLPYVEVDSVKKSIAKAQKAGASVMVEFQPVGKMGAIGIFVDPTGATIGVWEKGTPAKKPAKVKKPVKKAKR